MRHRNAIKRRDSNHFEIIRAIEAHGATVKDTSQIGGFVDCVFGYRKKNYLCEIKDGTKPPSKQKLTSAEEEFHETYRGTIVIFTSVQDVVDFFAALPVHIVSDHP